MKDKKKWFQDQCVDAGISAEDIMVFGEDYATNKDGDFLYTVKHKSGSLTMEFVLAGDLIECESSYPEWLLYLMENMIDGYREGDERFCPRIWCDRKDIARTFKECMCRNKEFSDDTREQMRKEPTYGAIWPHESETDNLLYLGLVNYDDEEAHDKFGYRYEKVIQPIELQNTKGFRFGVKIVNIDNFINIHSFIREKKQRRPFDILADLESKILQEWDENGIIRSQYLVREMCGVLVEFEFSHFEVEREIDENFRTIFVCYAEKFDI